MTTLKVTKPSISRAYVLVRKREARVLAEARIISRCIFRGNYLHTNVWYVMNFKKFDKGEYGWN